MDAWCQNKAVQIPTISILAIIFLIGATGNICTCLVIIRTKSLHTHANYCLLSLAFSDMLLLFLACPLQMYHFISCYASSNFMCKLQFYVKETYGFTSIFIICAFTAERWLAICYPLRNNVKLRNFCIALASVIIFALSVVTGLRMDDLFFKSETIENKTTNMCVISVSEFFEYTQVVIFIASYIIPVVMIATMGFQIAASVHSTSASARAQCYTRTSSRMIKLLVAVVVSFLICWSPHQISQLINYYFFVGEQEFLCNLASLSACCYYLNCAVNPVLYNMFSKNFRTALLHMISGGRPAATAKATCSASVESNGTPVMMSLNSSN